MFIVTRMPLTMRAVFRSALLLALFTISMCESSKQWTVLSIWPVTSVSRPSLRVVSCNRRRPLKYRIVECSEDAVAQCVQNKSDKNGFILSRVGRMFIQNNSQLESVVDGMVRGSVEKSNCFRNQTLTVCLKNAVYNITLCSSNDERGEWGMVQLMKVKKLRNCLTRVTRTALENICSGQLSEEQSVSIIIYYCSKLSYII